MFDDEIIAIKDKICSTVFPRQVYLFGSFARGSYTDDSDYDFYVVVPDDAGDKIELSQKAYKSLRGIRKRPVDIVVCDELTPYGVKIRYPQELTIEEYHVEKALAETEKLYAWLTELLEDISDERKGTDGNVI